MANFINSKKKFPMKVLIWPFPIVTRWLWLWGQTVTVSLGSKRPRGGRGTDKRVAGTQWGQRDTNVSGVACHGYLQRAVEGSGRRTASPVSAGGWLRLCLHESVPVEPIECAICLLESLLWSAWVGSYLALFLCFCNYFWQKLGTLGVSRSICWVDTLYTLIIKWCFGAYFNLKVSELSGLNKLVMVKCAFWWKHDIEITYAAHTFVF